MCHKNLLDTIAPVAVNTPAVCANPMGATPTNSNASRMPLVKCTLIGIRLTSILNAEQISTEKPITWPQLPSSIMSNRSAVLSVSRQSQQGPSKPPVIRTLPLNSREAV